MKNSLMLPLLAAVVAVSGCSSTTASGSRDRSITIVRPSDQTLRRGEINKVAIAILRQGFRADIQVSFEGLPAGVRVIEADRRFTEDDVVVTYTLFADNDAPPVREARVMVTAEGPDGLSASEVFHVTVDAGETGMK